MAAPVQLTSGNTMQVDFNNLTVTGYIMQSVTRNRVAAVEEVLSEVGETEQVITRNPGTELSCECLIPAAVTAATEALDIGSSVTLNSIKYRLTSSSIAYNNTETAKWSFDAIKEDSATYS